MMMTTYDQRILIDEERVQLSMWRYNIIMQNMFPGEKIWHVRRYVLIGSSGSSSDYIGLHRLFGAIEIGPIEVNFEMRKP